MAFLNLTLHGGDPVAINADRVLFVYGADIEEGDRAGTSRVYFGGGDNDYISVTGEWDEIAGLIEKAQANARRKAASFFNFPPDPSARW